ncbi:MAG: phosphatase PAP2 family protein [Hyphomonadaceae bacterium]
MSDATKAFAVFAACSAGFLLLAIFAPALAAFDRGLMIGLRAPGDLNDPIGPVWFEEAARDVTALGGTPLIFLGAGAISLSFLANGHGRLAAFALITIAGAQVASELLKALIDRPRPDLVAHETAAYSASFPSGHSMIAAAAFFTLAFALARESTRKRNRAFLYAIAAALTFLIGASRVYLGVHWPTDVLAGWLAGIAWAVGAAWIYRGLIKNAAE